jgi:hypothetical protein
MASTRKPTQKKSILDRGGCSDTTLSIYSLISAYVVDLYYNHLYNEAIKFKNSGDARSVTEGYRHAIFRFISAIDDKVKKHYKKQNYETLLIGITEYMKKFTSWDVISVSECVRKVAYEFVPEDYQSGVEKADQRNIVRKVLINVIKEFSKVVASDYITSIIDNHEEEVNIYILKEKIMDLLILERQIWYLKFVDSYTGGKESDDKKLALKMREEVGHVLEKNKHLTNELSEANKQIDIKDQQLKMLLDKYKLMHKKYLSMKDELNDVRSKVSVAPVVRNVARDAEKDEPYQSLLRPAMTGGNGLYRDPQNVKPSAPSLDDITRTMPSKQEMDHLIAAHTKLVPQDSGRRIIKHNAPVVFDDEDEDEEENKLLDDEEENALVAKNPQEQEEEDQKKIAAVMSQVSKGKLDIGSAPVLDW